MPSGTLHQRFQQQVALRGGCVAVTHGGRSLTYSELDGASDRVAELVSSRGLYIGLAMHRGLELAAGLLGILKAGAAYVPMDPEYPAVRLREMVEDSGVECVLTSGDFVMPGVENIVVDLQEPSPDNLKIALGEPADPAYMIYTSGSTGVPKGVVVSHGAVMNSLEGLTQVGGFCADDVILMKTSISFDPSVWEMFLAWIHGGCVVMAGPGVENDPEELVRMMQCHEVTWTWMAPAMLRAFLEVPGCGECPSLRHLAVGGEKLSFALKQDFFAKMGCRLFHSYGPTEAAIGVTYRECLPDVPEDPAPIGPALPGCAIYLLDDVREQVPDGEVGEMYLGGLQVAIGYHGRPELTAERFLADPWNEGARMYRSGDLGRRLPTGEFLCLGRIDQQLKIRGFRIEPGEIEGRLEAHPGVRAAIVGLAALPTGEPGLVAWVVAKESLTSAHLRDYLVGCLPGQMIPSRFVFMDELPLSPGGKVDRKALPPPSSERPACSAVYVAPSTHWQKGIAEIWRKNLHLEDVGVDDPYFELGGDSLSLVQLHTRLSTVMPRPVSLPELFGMATIRKLAEHCEDPGFSAQTTASEDDRAARRHAARRGRTSR